MENESRSFGFRLGIFLVFLILGIAGFTFFFYLRFFTEPGSPTNAPRPAATQPANR